MVNVTWNNGVRISAKKKAEAMGVTVDSELLVIEAAPALSSTTPHEGDDEGSDDAGGVPSRVEGRGGVSLTSSASSASAVSLSKDGNPAIKETNVNITTNQNTNQYTNIIVHGDSIQEICPPKHFGCAEECDQGLFSVSRKTVQFADTFDSSMHIHVNGPRHIPAKACTPSSNCCRLAAIIPRMKFDTGSHQSRTNKNRVSKKKRLKQNKSLLTIIPTLTHPVSNLKDDFYTYVDGGDVNNPPIQPPSSEFKPNAILSIRDKDLQVINSHLSFPDKGLIFRLGNQASDILLVPRRDALKHIQKQDDDSITLCNAFDEVEKKVKSTQARGSRTQSIVREDTQHKYICVGNQTNRRGCWYKKIPPCSSRVSKAYSI